MFWRSVVGKLAITILLLVCFVLFILTILLLEFFESFHIQEAEKEMMETAGKISEIVEQHEDRSLITQMAKYIKDPASRVLIVYDENTIWTSGSSDEDLEKLQVDWLLRDEDLTEVLTGGSEIKKEVVLPDGDSEALIVGTPIPSKGKAIFVYQSLAVIDQTKAETTKIIYLAAGIAIVLTTIFAFFLSTRITSPLIKMREAAFDLTRGEFNTKVPILTHDEIGELAMVFNRMGRHLKFHINALRQEKEQLSSIVSSMADGVVTLNRNGDMIVTNPPAEKFIEDWYFENNVQSEEQKQLPKELNQILQQVILGETEVLQELHIQGRDWVMIMTPLYDQSYVRGAVAVIRDMTEERRLDKLRKDFIANVSHELRTPISLLQGYSEAIVDDIAESKEEINELAQIIHEESLRMGRLVNELLDIARMEAGHITLNIEPVEIGSFADRILKKFQGIANENRIHLKLIKNIDEPVALIDPDRVEQVFTNLIDNAIRHSQENGNVLVTVENDANRLAAAIADSGSGIPEDDIPFVFERFYKADKSRERNKQKKGTGLGLAIAKNIIEAHNGTISVKSKQNQGTTFSFEIPENHEK